MQTYDAVMITIIVAATILGAVKGFAWQLASLVTIVTSYVVALRGCETLAPHLRTAAPWNQFLAMLILFVLTATVICGLFRLARGGIDRMELRDFDAHVGAVFGALKGVMYCTLATLFAVTLAGQTARDAVTKSSTGNAIVKVVGSSRGMAPSELAAFVRSIEQ